jgi:hypothetical protein
MKNHCTGLVIAMVSLCAFGVAYADIEFTGVLDVGVSVTRIDSVTLRSPDMTLYTAGWGSHVPFDTHYFAGVTAWPETLTLHGTVNALPCRQTIPHLLPRIWHAIGIDHDPPQVLFWDDYSGVEEPRLAAAPLPLLDVSPSVVTGQMTASLQSFGTGRRVIQIHDAVGNVVRSLALTAEAEDAATATWNREDDLGHLVPQGVYFCRCATSEVIAVRKVLVAR